MVELTLPMPVEKLEAHPHVRMNWGKIVLQRGPVVYCLEETDNGAYLADIAIPLAAKLTIATDRTLGGAAVLLGQGIRRDPVRWRGKLYQPRSSASRKVRVKAVPYCLWNNRGDGEMVVWVAGK